MLHLNFGENFAAILTTCYYVPYAILIVCFMMSVVVKHTECTSCPFDPHSKQCIHKTSHDPRHMYVGMGS